LGGEGMEQQFIYLLGLGNTLRHNVLCPCQWGGLQRPVEWWLYAWVSPSSSLLAL
jgi:hypothetical protein